MEISSACEMELTRTVVSKTGFVPDQMKMTYQNQDMYLKGQYLHYQQIRQGMESVS